VGLTLRLLQLFYQLPKTSELGRAINAHIIVAAYFLRSLPIVQSMFLCRIVFCLYHYRPRGRCSCLHQHFRHLFSELHHTSMGHARLVCTQLYIVTHLVEGRVLQVPFFSKGLLYTVPLLLSLTTPFSVKETLMDFGYTYAPNLIHQGASVITEISSAHGDKNSASSKQERSHSWHRINSTALQKGQKLYKMTKKLKGALQNLGARAYARNNNVQCAHARTMRSCWAKNPRTC
jgi:hypothetical protein